MENKTTSVCYKHWFCAAHRLPNNQRGCGRIHGHNYLIEMELTGPVSTDGLILDFCDIKLVLGWWLDKHWDHRLILAQEDPILANPTVHEALLADGSLVVVPFVPTAENMANHLLEVFDKYLERYTPAIRVSKIVIHETHKGRAEVSKSN